MVIAKSAPAIEKSSKLVAAKVTRLKFFPTGTCGEKIRSKLVNSASKLELDSPLSIDPHDLRSPDQRFLVHVLVPVDQQPWLCPLDVTIKCLKPYMNLGVAFVYLPG